MSNSRISRSGLAATAALVCGVATPASAVVPAHPAAVEPAAKHMLFRVRGPSGASVYLLGSVHVLAAEAGKLPAEIDTAFAHARTVAFETSLDTVQLRAQELLGRA